MIKNYTKLLSKDYNKRNFLKSNLYFKNEPLTLKILEKVKSFKKKINILEIGAGNCERIKYIQNLKNKKINIIGVDPATNNKICKRGASYELPFKNKKFDIIYFGFCLYMLKPEDLFKTLFETDRILKNNSWLIIYDFYSESFVRKNYKHLNQKIFKMDYTKIFSWHPFYKLESQIKYKFKTNNKWTDNPNNLVTIITLRKKII